MEPLSTLKTFVIIVKPLSSDAERKCENNIGARIESLSQTGLLILKFDEDIQDPTESKKNYNLFQQEQDKTFEEQILKLDITAGFDSDISLLDFAWSLVKWKPKTIEIQLTF